MINNHDDRTIWLDYFGIGPESEDDYPDWDEIIPFEPTGFSEDIHNK